MPQNMAQLEPMLKEVYENTLNKQLNDEHKSYTRINRTGAGVAQKPYGGKYVNFPIHTARNSGIGARNENEALPDAGYQETKEGTLNLRNQYGAIEISGQVFEMASSERQAFVNAVDLEVDRIKIDLSVDRNRQYFGNGNGSKGTVVSIVGNDITLDSVRHIGDNNILDVVVPTNGTSHGSGVKVIAVDEDSNTVTVQGTLSGVTAGDILVNKGSWNREWTGLDAMIGDTNTLYGIDPTNTRVWRSHMMNQTTDTPLAEATWMRMSDRIRRAGGKTSAILTTRGVRRAYWQLLASNKRFVNTQSYKGGYDTLAFEAGDGGVIPIIADDDCQPGTSWFVDEKQINMHRPHGFKFMDRDGSMWKQKTDANGRYDAYLATLYEYSELSTYRRNTHGKITGILEDTE